jgi:hypothetical protein
MKRDPPPVTSVVAVPQAWELGVLAHLAIADFAPCTSPQHG